MRELLLDGVHAPGGPSKLTSLLTGKVNEGAQRVFEADTSSLPGEQPIVLSPADIMTKIQNGDFNPVNTFRKQLGPQELKQLGIRLGPIPAMYDLVSEQGEKVTVLAMENAAFIMSPNHPLVNDLQSAMADVLVQSARAQQPIISAKGINDALKVAGLPVLKNKTPLEILEYGADLMGGMKNFYKPRRGF